MPDYEICGECGHAVIESVYYACKCNDVEQRITELESALLALVNHSKRGPWIDYYLYDNTPIGVAVRLLGKDSEQV